jgi:hypothetical protein
VWLCKEQPTVVSTIAALVNRQNWGLVVFLRLLSVLSRRADQPGHGPFGSTIACRNRPPWRLTAGPVSSGGLRRRKRRPKGIGFGSSPASAQSAKTSWTPRLRSSVRMPIQNFAPSVCWIHMPSTSLVPSRPTPTGA